MSKQLRRRRFVDREVQGRLLQLFVNCWALSLVTVGGLSVIGVDLRRAERIGLCRPKFVHGHHPPDGDGGHGGFAAGDATDVVEHDPRHPSFRRSAAEVQATASRSGRWRTAHTASLTRWRLLARTGRDVQRPDRTHRGRAKYRTDDRGRSSHAPRKIASRPPQPTRRSKSWNLPDSLETATPVGIG